MGQPYIYKNKGIETKTKVRDRESKNIMWILEKIYNKLVVQMSFLYHHQLTFIDIFEEMMRLYRWDPVNSLKEK